MPNREAQSALGLLRVSAGMKQADLAKRAGVARETISRIERGLKRPQRATKARLAAALGQPVEVVFPGDTSGGQATVSTNPLVIALEQGGHHVAAALVRDSLLADELEAAGHNDLAVQLRPQDT